MRQFKAVFLLICLTGIAVSGQKIRVDIAGMGTTGPYRLGYEHIIAESESITYKDSLLVRGDDYRIEYDDGFIVLARPLASTDTLLIEFEVIPIELKQSYVWLKPVATGETDTVEYTPSPQLSHWGQRLDVVGSKGFAINIGNVGEPSLTQSLDLDISGEVSRGVFIKGSISDRNFATSPGGATQSLDELDKIIISLETKGFRGDFGDLELKGIDNSLLNFNRKLTGLNVSGETGDFRGATALAFSPGKQVELFFYGVDGKQGPYILSSPEISSSTSLGNVFIPGTEEVYLDGIRLDRGNENDYNIDYYEKTIEFTPKNIISSKSRITVKIQFAPEGYRRSFYHINTFRDNKLSIGVQYLGEKDDKNNPRNFELGEIERSAISDAGSFADSSFSSGIKYTGAGLGDYTLAIDSLGQNYYEYVGTNQGDYQINFSQVGQNQGNYEFAGSGRFLYIGRGNGAYLPIVFYPLPESRDYASVIFNRPGDLYIDGELAVSRYDRNTLSNKDDLLTGLGFLGSAGYKKEDWQFLDQSWTADLINIKLRTLDTRFSVPGIIDAPEFFRQYNIPSNRSVSGEKLIEYQSGVLSSVGDNIRAGGGFFDSDDFRAHRGFGQFNVAILNRFGVSADAELTTSEDKGRSKKSNWNKYDAGVEITNGPVRPGVVYRHELSDGLFSLSDGFNADEYETFVKTLFTTQISTQSRLLYRDQKYFSQSSGNNGNWERQLKQYQLEQGISYGDPGRGLNSELNLSRLYQKRYYPIDEIIIRNMGDLKLNYNSSDYGITYYESVNGTGRLSRAREYIFVGDGKGDYRKDGEDYVPEPGGDYIEVIRQLGEGDTQAGVTGYEISGGMRARLNGKILSNNNLLARFSYDNDFSHRTNLASGIRLKAGYLLPIQKFDQTEMSLRTYDYSQRLTFKLNRTGDYIRHTLKSSQSDGIDYEFEVLNNKTLANIADLKLLTRKTVGFLISTELASEIRWLYSGNIDLTRIKTGLTPEIRPSRNVKIEIPLEYTDEKEKIGDIRIQSYAIALESVINFRRLGRFEFNGGYARVETDREDVFLPYVTAGGRKAGDNYNAMISSRFKLNSYSQFELRYTYRKLGDGYTNSNLRLEAKAEF